MWYEYVLYILIVIVMLAVMISIHEAGHLAMAKLFHVYCFEYSIGFGPKLLKVKRKNGETYFSIRAVPFGGYVSMYGEGGAVPEGFETPAPERSLEAIAKWKKCIILVAGVTLNLILGMVLIYIGDAAFPVYYYAHSGIADDATSQMISVTLDSAYGNELLSYIDAQKEEGYTAKDYYVHIPVAQVDSFTFPILDSEVHFMVKEGDIYVPGKERYVAVYSPSTLVATHTMASSIALYPASVAKVPENLSALGVTALPQITDKDGKPTKLDTKIYAEGDYIDLDLTLVPLKKGDSIKTQYEGHRLVVDGTETKVGRYALNKDKAFVNDQINLEVISAYNDFAGGWRMWAKDFPDACTMIVRGFVSLFQPGGFQNLSGIIGITAAMPQISASGGARLVFFFAGMISINLAFFNLLPFPGLDGWQLLITVVEGVSKKKVPEKFKTVMTLIGFVLLFGLMLAVVVKDIIALF